MKIWKRSILFYLGGCIYVALELLWRGRSHGSMFLAGGLCLLLIGHLNEIQPRLPFFLRSIFGAMIITTVELGFGLAVNREYTVWDYRHQPGNLWGQICPQFSFLWIALAALVLRIYEPLDKEIQRRGCRLC